MHRESRGSTCSRVAALPCVGRWSAPPRSPERRPASLRQGPKFEHSRAPLSATKKLFTTLCEDLGSGKVPRGCSSPTLASFNTVTHWRESKTRSDWAEVALCLISYCEKSRQAE